MLVTTTALSIFRLSKQPTDDIWHRFNAYYLHTHILTVTIYLYVCIYQCKPAHILFWQSLLVLLCRKRIIDLMKPKSFNTLNVFHKNSFTHTHTHIYIMQLHVCRYVCMFAWLCASALYLKSALLCLIIKSIAFLKYFPTCWQFFNVFLLLLLLFKHYTQFIH